MRVAMKAGITNVGDESMKRLKTFLDGWRKKRARGVAILTVMVSIALMMAIVTEMSTKETMRYKLAINERDALQAEALAQSGANFAQLILTVQEPLQKYMATFAKSGMQLPAYTVWDLMPIDSVLLKGITDGSFMPDFSFLSTEKGSEKKPTVAEEKDEEKKKTLVSDNTSKNVPLFGPYQAPEGGYGAFAGRFSTEIKDEESKISIRKWPKHLPKKQKMIADQIFRVLAKKEHEFLFDNRMGNASRIGPGQLVGYIYDYISDDERAVDISATAQRWGLDKIGDKRSQYVDSPNITPKRAPMDSIAELRLVPGMTDAIFQLLNSTISIYAEGESVNILSASDEVLTTVFYICAKSPETSAFLRPGFDADVIADWNRKKNEGTLEISADGIIAHLEEHGVEVDKEECKKEVGTASKVFTVKSTATVGTVTKTLLVRVRSAGGITSLYQYQYL
jgi:type II secretory pathway component PulK